MFIVYYFDNANNNIKVYDFATSIDDAQQKMIFYGKELIENENGRKHLEICIKDITTDLSKELDGYYLIKNIDKIELYKKLTHINNIKGWTGIYHDIKIDVLILGYYSFSEFDSKLIKQYYCEEKKIEPISFINKTNKKVTFSNDLVDALQKSGFKPNKEHRFKLPIKKQSIKSIPIESIPIKSIPIKSIPIESIPIESIPIESIPIESIPIESIPVESISDESIPVESIPDESIPVESIPIKSIPIESIPNESIPVESIPIESIPVESISDESIPVESIPVESISDESILVESIPDESIPEELMLDESIPDESIPDESIPDELIPEESIPDELIPEESIPDESIPDESIPEESIPEESMLDESIPDESTYNGNIKQTNTNVYNSKYIYSDYEESDYDIEEYYNKFNYSNMINDDFENNLLNDKLENEISIGCNRYCNINSKCKLCNLPDDLFNNKIRYFDYDEMDILDNNNNGIKDDEEYIDNSDNINLSGLKNIKIIKKPWKYD
jgi:hypothetical protein